MSQGLVAYFFEREAAEEVSRRCRTSRRCRMRRAGSRTRRNLYSGIDIAYRFRYTDFEFDHRGMSSAWPGHCQSDVTPDPERTRRRPDSALAEHPPGPERGRHAVAQHRLPRDQHVLDPDRSRYCAWGRWSSRWLGLRRSCSRIPIMRGGFAGLFATRHPAKSGTKRISRLGSLC
jgi:hypothetical protein